MIVDAWSNLRSPAATKRWRESEILSGVANLLGANAAFEERSCADVVRELEANGVDLAIVTGMAGRGSSMPTENYRIDEVLEACALFPDRLRAALMVEGLGSMSSLCREIERAAADPALAVVRVVPMAVNEPLNSARFYPIYERCEAFGLPVSINVGVPGPKLRARNQDPMLLDDVLIDFPDLVVVAAHMGHPWEALIIRFMRKYANLYLSNSAYLAGYMDPAVVSFMASSAGQRRLIFASDAPMLSLARSLASARQLPLAEEAMADFLGHNAVRVFSLDKPRRRAS